MEKTLKIYNGKILTPYRIISGTVVVVDGKIKEVAEGNIDVPGAVEIDAKGNYIAPGFIDIHVHGGGGHDFMDGSEEAFLKIAETHAKYGTTGLMPTTLTSELDELYNTLDLYKKADKKNKMGAQFLGMHLEGPYFAMSQRGAQDPRYIRNPDPEEYKDILSRSSDIKRWSAAPELKGAIEFGNYLRSKGILVAMAHTDAIYEEALEAFEAGFTLGTHFYSCMSGVSRRNCFRYAGVIETAYLLDEMDVEIIADGIHLPAPLLKLIYKIKGPDRIALITDSMRAAGMPPGDSILGSKHNGLKVLVEDGVAKLPDRTSFAGSVATCDRLVRNMVNMAEVPLLEAVKMASLTPANILGLGASKGSLICGKDADIVIFDSNINVSTTIVQGRIVYNKLD
ncbi:MAG: N-acetylglucosamine-6-phosphate deacetylase [Sphingobacteriales bacterium 17-39-43]|jgi:N-acetylglucosamine-6-phosphate deacetylase|uniref:N-acetylglucosamine-6-phosphate deacetylase n=1 Tax=Daejeonella sp. TaxID=2805397 RepID=UPI000BCBFC2F|nr:N-acetylglucosamine-6-phosphate deacetylase [Daejeonella sp.]OYZ31253.1 MAG: N-acetylglucosamine-6-phosphate deacetylase [Sphingobacteriales bacterium 16-39-50]OYZ60649.1 MAG: N-acetylglucosamine-6-phosphate deacetylase [Sphingobacteriales bacterium 24-40-4]OZA24132.1 MAG: N-acetylglucosamine-6-phosphate deacetylase [Sphingobacteriales bacterium 17-39-43]HQS05755.1 N-acetylglucosamine-6-phosphate deacetylase [Daejeonella sp.]HQS50254.1 N-acetylglucosamine-6-phosphate deacetylase [Daejeonell